MNINTEPTINLGVVKRLFYVMLATLLVVAGLPLFGMGRAAAATTQLDERSIQLSDSAPSGGGISTTPGSGTAVTYRVSFTLADSAGSLVIDFCSNDPIIGDTCTVPTGMNVSAAALNSAAITGNIDTTHHWSATDTSNASDEQILLADDDTSGGSDDAGVGAQVFDLTGITNPSALGSFYARIYTYHNTNSPSSAGYVGPANTGPGTGPGSYTDYGGIALSTAQVVTITARVQETLTFCVSGADPQTWVGAGSVVGNGDCSSTQAGTAPAVTLGHGSSTKILDNSAIDTNAVWSQLSTNATDGAIIDMRNSNTCGGLSADSGSTCAIPPISSDGTVPHEGVPIAGGAAMTHGVSAFGLNVESYTQSTPPTGQSGNTTPASFYFNASHNNTTGVGTSSSSGPDLWYGMDSTSSSAAIGGTVRAYQGGVNTTFGSEVASTAGPVFDADTEYIFAATAALTTPAGIYQANLSLIATGTF